MIEALPPGVRTGVLDPRIRAALAAAPVPDYERIGPAAVRAFAAARAAARPRLNEPVARVEARQVPGGPAVRLYVPEGPGPFPLLVYYHGGGWVAGTLDDYDDLCRSLCRRTPALVASVDYRLAPEAPFPAAHEDAVAALRWAATLGATALAVGGDSAGGNLAAAAAIAARDGGGPAVAFQMLLYPVADADFDRASYHQFGENHGLTRANMRWFWRQYGASPGDPRAAVLKADLRGLPPAFVAIAEFDVLRDEGEALAARLEAAGTRTRAVRFSGMNHGFMTLAGMLPTADYALTIAAEALRSATKS